MANDLKSIPQTKAYSKPIFSTFTKNILKTLGAMLGSSGNPALCQAAYHFAGANWESFGYVV